MPRTDRSSTRREALIDPRPDAWVDSGWGWGSISLALAFLGGGLVAATMASLLLPPLTALVVGAGVWAVALVAPVLLALRHGPPSGLFRVRVLEILVGLVAGAIVRLAAVAVSTPKPAGWPTLPTLDGKLASETLLADVLIPVIVAPVTEELFFRGLLLVSIVAVLQRWGGSRTVSAASGVLLTTGLFVALHAVTGDVSGWADATTLAIVATACAALVLVTGRIWSAVALHLSFNALAVGAAVLGTIVGVGAA